MSYCLAYASGKQKREHTISVQICAVFLTLASIRESIDHSEEGRYPDL